MTSEAPPQPPAIAVFAALPPPPPPPPPSSAQAPAVVVPDVVSPSSPLNEPQRLSSSAAPADPTPAGTPRNRRRWLLVGLVVVLVAAGVSAGLAWSSPDTHPPDSTSTLPIDSVPRGTTAPNVAPEIRAVNRVTPSAEQNLVILGSGFGSRPPFTGNVECFRIQDVTRQWEAGHVGSAGVQERFGPCLGAASTDGDAVMVKVAEWSDKRIVVSRLLGAFDTEGYGLAPGDQIVIEVANASTGALAPAATIVVDSGDAPTSLQTVFCRAAESFHGHERAFDLASADAASVQAFTVNAIGVDLATMHAEAPAGMAAAVASIERFYASIGQFLQRNPGFTPDQLLVLINGLRPPKAVADGQVASFCHYTP